MLSCANARGTALIALAVFISSTASATAQREVDIGLGIGAIVNQILVDRDASRQRQQAFYMAEECSGPLIETEEIPDLIVFRADLGRRELETAFGCSLPRSSISAAAGLFSVLGQPRRVIVDPRTEDDLILTISAPDGTVFGVDFTLAERVAFASVHVDGGVSGDQGMLEEVRAQSFPLDEAMVRNSRPAPSVPDYLLGLSLHRGLIGSDRRSVQFMSDPAGASVWVNEQSFGKTALIGWLREAAFDAVEMRMEGYQPCAAEVAHVYAGQYLAQCSLSPAD